MNTSEIVEYELDSLNPMDFVDLLRAETKKKLKGNINRPVTKRLTEFVDFVVADMAHDFGLEINVDIVPKAYAVNAVIHDDVYALPLENFNDAGGLYLINSNMILIAYTDDVEIVESFEEYKHFRHSPLIGRMENVPYGQLFTRLTLHEIAHFWDHFYFNTRSSHGRTFRFTYGTLVYRYGHINILE